MRNIKVYSGGFLVPGLLIYIILFLLPCIMGLYYSFTNWNSMSDTMKFIGLDNYKQIWSAGTGTLKVFNSTILYAFGTTVFKIILGLILALLLNEGIRSKNVLRMIFFMPITLSPLIIGIIFAQIFHPTGVLNDFLLLVGLDSLAHAWIAEPKLALWSSMSVEIWKASGFSMAIFLAGLQMIPKSLYEAADIDGANLWGKFKHITLPLLMPSISINSVLGVISGLKVFDMIYPLTNGGPGRATEVINITVFNEFSKGDYGYATALGVVMFVFITIISFAVLGAFTKANEVEIS